MKNSSQQKQYKFKAGIFVIASLTLLIFCVLWIRHFALAPKMKITAVFQNPGPMQKGVQAYFKGINIGSVTDLDYSKDFQNSLIHITIYNKDVDIPDNSYARIKMEGITGQKYVDIIPKKIPSKTMLSDNQQIQGVSGVGFSQITDFLVDEIKSGRMESIMANSDELLKNTNLVGRKIIQYSNRSNISEQDIDDIIINSSKFVKNLQNMTDDISSEFGANIDETSNNMAIISTKLKDFLSGSPTGAAAGIDQASINELITDSDTLVKNWNCITCDLYKDIKKAQLIENISYAFCKMGLTFDEADKLLTSLECDGIDKNMKQLIMETLYNTNKTAKKISCMSDGVSDMLNKRFILLRLMFGKPGINLQKCKQK